jgi:hypothetical protein
MKKTLLLLGLVLLPAALFAQGTVNFANNNSTRMTTNSTAVPPPGQNPNATGNTQLGYTIGFYIAPQGTVDVNAFTLVGPTTSSLAGIAPGTFNGNGGTNLTIQGNTGQTIAFQVRAWSTSAGATYEIAKNVLNAYRGVSAIGEVTPSTGTTLAATLFGTAAGQVGGFVLTPNTIPEPSSIALGLLGLGAIALFRRRK